MFEGLRQGAENEYVTVGVKIEWNIESPEGVKEAGRSRQVISPEDTDEEEEEKEKVTIQVMAYRDEQAKGVKEEFDLLRDRVTKYEASRHTRGEKALLLVESLEEEKVLLTRAFVSGRDLKRKYESMR